MFLLIVMYLTFAALMVVPLAGIWLASRSLSRPLRLLIFVVAATILLTPSWAPATITIVSMPFGMLFFVALFTWSWDGLPQLLGFAPTWHLVAFPCTAVVAYFVGRRLLRQHSAPKLPQVTQ